MLRRVKPTSEDATAQNVRYCCYVDDAFKLTVDTIFPKKKKKEEDPQSNGCKPLSVLGYRDDENMWEFIVQIGFLKTTTISRKQETDFTNAKNVKENV